MWVYLILIFLSTTFKVRCTLLENLVDDVIYPDNIKPDFVRTCFGNLGCFYTGPPFFHPKFRPVTVSPANDTITKFFLFTPDTPSKRYELEANERSLNNSNFKGNLPTKVLIHGFETNSIQEIYEIKDALMKEANFNVIVVDWTQNNKFPLWQAIANARLNAVRVSKLLQFLLKNTSLKSSNIHLIAHSLGAHMAGWVGSRVKQIARISGLDPAGPYFHNAPPTVRLDITDADFVDIIHTNGGKNATEGYGLEEPIGHINFYPNGGNTQPGCESITIVNSSISTNKVANTCAHSRSIHLYAASINNTICRFLATPCENWKKFERGDCQPRKSKIREMGFHAKKLPRVPRSTKLFLKTSDDYPFCKKD